MPFDVAQQLEALTRMSAPQLRELWQRTGGRAHSGYVQKDFLVRAIAYRLQEKAYGGLSPALRRTASADVQQARLLNPRFTQESVKEMHGGG